MAITLNPETFLNRECAWIRFNQRVLEYALDPQTPLLEQAKFSAIFSNNLDEFFMVRVASLKSQVEAGVDSPSLDGYTPRQQLLKIQEQLRPLLTQQQQHFRDRLKPELCREGIELLDYEQLNRRQQTWADDYFRSTVFPILTPLAVDPAHPFPFISNLSINVAALIRDPDSGEQQFARVKVPCRSVPRLVQLPLELSDNELTTIYCAVPLEQIVANNLERLFPGMEVQGHYIFRITRDADLEYLELEADDLLQAIEASLRKRQMGGTVVRLEVPQNMPEAVVDRLMEGLDVEMEDLYRIGGLVGLDDLSSLLRIARPDLKDPPHRGRLPAPFARAQKSLLADGSLAQEDFESVFDVLKRGDLLVHHPYDSFSASVEEFINQAADDPAVLGIKVTLYRTSKDSAIIAALERAAARAKQVMALVELKARFDEDNNINWARQLERAGVHVVYGVLGLKTHTKIMLVVRQEKQGVRTYVHIGTGNYNSRTSRLYTDIGLLSARSELGADLVELFNYLTGFSKQLSFRQVLVAPVSLRRRMEALIDREAGHARAGRGAHIRAKMNALADPRIILKLYEASQAGVRIELVVRGICCLRPGVPELSENISVTSVIGRFLEHSRIFWFANDGQPQAYIGSADLMRRNLDRRVECMTPVVEPGLRNELEVLLQTYLDDRAGSWIMQPDGSYQRHMPQGEGSNCQLDLIEGWKALQGGPTGANSSH
ncbi:MAG: polyphosphate kinase 1 [Aphanocapsa feldmannii 277cV]|uniref:Polyphosphate kinase n=2 Tax=Aphanocapsa feldmannii TaxID=192050 RepID=A0A524RN53_9CHRO|nr:MAG: polyphosphate kinase 1 [Aphanocapsa feldmannii 277cV]TGH22481.1 MAG: polyphosphate kinase 1 [Aphanocapsa feldmannii 277cI]